jgi:hypothetical protein
MRAGVGEMYTPTLLVETGKQSNGERNDNKIAASGYHF